MAPLKRGDFASWRCRPDHERDLQSIGARLKERFSQFAAERPPSDMLNLLRARNQCAHQNSRAPPDRSDCESSTSSEATQPERHNPDEGVDRN
jgi:hypothetical protein